MTTFFSNSSPKIPTKGIFSPKFRHFWSQIQEFLFFRKILNLDKFEGADFNYFNSFCKILAQNYPHEAFLVPNSGILYFTKFRSQTNSRVLNSNITIFFSNFIPKIPKETFLISNLTIFISTPNLMLRQIRGRWLQT